jgi:sRNA-binding carbon storage regulator CsrA/DNA-binding Xre family transcriptional regulator
MLILTRKPSQSLSIHPHPTLDPGTPVEQVFADGPIHVQVLAVQGRQVRLGVAAPAGFCIVRDALLPPAAVSPLSEGARRVLARKLKVLMFLNCHSTHSLAAAAGLAPARVRAAESGVGALVLDDLEKIARVLEVKVVELFISPGRTAVERVVLGLLEGEGYK